MMSRRISAKQLKALLFERQEGKCCYCGGEIELHPEPWGFGNTTPPNFATFEHLRRKRDGGGSNPDNLALACFLCNTSRGETNWVEFKTLMASGLTF